MKWRVFLVIGIVITSFATTGILTLQPPREDEENDSLEQANSLDLDESLQGEIQNADDEDWYVITVENSDVLEALLEGPVSSAGLRVTIFDAEEKLAQGQKGPDAARVTAPIESDETYYIRVDGPGAFGIAPTGKYTLTATASGSDAYEPNNEQQNAAAVDSGEEITGQIETRDEADWFEIDVEKGESVTATLTTGEGTDLGDSFHVGLYNPAGEQVDEWETSLSSDSKSAGTTAEQDGRYFVEVTGDREQYSLVIKTTRTDDFEPNEDPEDPERISKGDTITGQISEGDIDVFAFDAAAGERFQVEAAVSESSGDLRVRLKGPGLQTEKVRMGGLRGSDKSIETSAEEGDTHFVIIDQGDTLGTGSYTLTVQSQEDETAMPETDTETETATDTETNTHTKTESETATSTETDVVTPSQTVSKTETETEPSTADPGAASTSADETTGTATPTTSETANGDTSHQEASATPGGDSSPGTDISPTSTQPGFGIGTAIIALLLGGGLLVGRRTGRL